MYYCVIKDFLNIDLTILIDKCNDINSKRNILRKTRIIHF